jgi:hypothetical protein
MRELPPVAATAVASMVLVIVGTIYLSANIANDPKLGIPIGLLVVAGLLLAAAVVTLTRVRDFAWGTFYRVARWALLGYLVIAGMIEFVFVRDSTPGARLATLSIMLAVFVLDVTLILAFSVARYQPAD